MWWQLFQVPFRIPNCYLFFVLLFTAVSFLNKQLLINNVVSWLFVLLFTAVSFLSKQLLINNVVSWPFVWLEKKKTIWGQQHMSQFFSWLINLILINWYLYDITHPFPVLLFCRIRLCFNTSQKQKSHSLTCFDQWLSTSVQWAS